MTDRALAHEELEQLGTTSRRLLNELLEAAKSWGWSNDQGIGRDVDRAWQRFDAAVKAYVRHAKRSEQEPAVLVVVDGGVVQHVVANRPTDVMVCDYDVDGADEENLTKVPQSDGKEEPANLYEETPQISKRTIQRFFDLIDERKKEPA